MDILIHDNEEGTCMLIDVAIIGDMNAVAYPEIFSGGSTNSVDRGQREQGSGGGSPPVRGSAKFASG
jgi:hypothetical protein